MENHLTTVIVSAFGRGHWMAYELVQQGFSVALIDVTESLGRWSPEDWEGPFGLLQSPSLTQNQLARLDQEDYAESVEDGMSFWVELGPVDMRSAQTQYVLSKRNIPKDVIEQIQKVDCMDKINTDLIKKLNERDFSENWFYNLACYLSSPLDLKSSEAMKANGPLPLFAPYSLRRVSRKGLEKSLDWLKSAGVKVYKKSTIKDISIIGSQFLSIEVISDWSGVVGGSQFIWCLSSKEADYILPKHARQLFPSGSLESRWFWMRYRLQLSGPVGIDSLPLQFLMIGDLALPWTHENFALAQKTVDGSHLDVWVRGPSSHRFEKLYLRELGVSIMEVLKRKIPESEIKIVNYPPNYEYDEAELGPAHFQIYDVKEWNRFIRKTLKNIYFDGPETWTSLEWNGQFHHQASILKSLYEWKKEHDKKMMKLSAKEAQL